VASRANGVARRQTIITAVLLIVGALLALALESAARDTSASSRRHRATVDNVIGPADKRTSV
jgi:hypothetical protein